MKALKYIIFLVLILIIGFCIYVAVQPNTYLVERSRSIKAPTEVIYNHVIDFKTWQSWSSWVEEDPDMKIMLLEQTKGIGASYSWEDTNGIGTMTTLATVPNTSIAQEMQIGDYPKSEVNWTFTQNDDGTTNVKWSINGDDLQFMFKAFTTLMGGMDRLIGPHYERSLELLETHIQKEMKHYTILVNGITEHSGGFYLYNSTSCKYSNFHERIAEQFPKIVEYAKTNQIASSGQPFVIYHKFDVENDAVIFSCGIPTSSKITTSDPDILTGKLESFKAVKTTLNGDYENLQEAWDKTLAFISKQGLKEIQNELAIESYLVGPNETRNPADWITELFIAIE